MSEKENKPSIIQAVLFVKDKEYVTPHYIRVTLTGEDVLQFKDTTIGVNNKIFIPPAGVDQVHFPAYDVQTNEWTHPPEEVRPFVRTYTHRAFDLEKKEMVVDFVAHGDSGPASAWAIAAKPGDALGIAMKDKKSTLYPQADWYLLVADGTGIPVLAAILESLPAEARGIAHIEVQDKEDLQHLTRPEGIQINWLYNEHPGTGTLLADAVKHTVIPEDHLTTRFGYVAAEFTAVKNIRDFLRKDKGWEREELYAYAYWKLGVSEDGSVKDRQQEQREQISTKG